MVQVPVERAAAPLDVPPPEDAEPPPFAAEVRAIDGHAIVAVRGEIDPVTASEFSHAIEEASSERGHLIVDLSETTFMDSSAMAVLEQASRRLGQLPEALVLRNANDTARKLLQITGVRELVTIDDGVDPDPSPLETAR
ncbi:MAG: STAS domain-containing protein [Actinomycetota bacterium]|nr:STAS domain-containing protein [Actinomycetota bacterium]